MGRVIIPYDRFTLREPHVFLLGPIGGAPVWREEANELLWLGSPDIPIVSPDHSLPPRYERFRLRSPDRINGQFYWEDHYLESAGKRGVILGYLPAEQEHNCAHPYGMDTRRELGTIIGQYKAGDGPSFVLGAEQGFSGLRTLRRAFQQERPGFPIHTSLQDACDAALRKLFESNV